MREFIQAHFEAEIIRWAEPVDEDVELFEVLYEGQILRADSAPLILRSLVDLTPERRRVIYLPANGNDWRDSKAA